MVIQVIQFKTFYESLYSSRIDQNVCNTKLSCEGMLSVEECLESLKTMDSGKSPGTDGLPAEFYKVFWEDVSTFLIDALNLSFSKGYLSISQRRGLITLLPKKNKPRQYLKNWRPIKPSIAWNGLSLRKHSLSTTSEPLLKVGSNYSTAALQAAYKTTAGPPTSFNSVEEFDKAAPYRHTSLFYV